MRARSGTAASMFFRRRNRRRRTIIQGASGPISHGVGPGRARAPDGGRSCLGGRDTRPRDTPPRPSRCSETTRPAPRTPSPMTPERQLPPSCSANLTTDISAHIVAAEGLSPRPLDAVTVLAIHDSIVLNMRATPTAESGSHRGDADHPLSPNGQAVTRRSESGHRRPVPTTGETTPDYDTRRPRFPLSTRFGS